MTSSAILILIFMSLGAAFIQRVSGFGFGIFIMTALPYLMPSYGEATTLSGLMALVTSALIMVRYYRFLHWRLLLPILITFLLISFVAVQFVALASDGLLKRILGAVLILASIWFFWFSHRIHLPATLPVQISMGTLSGLMGGLFGMQGPPAVLYFIASTERKEEYMALCQSYFLIGNLTMTFYRMQCGFFTSAVCTGWCYGIAAVLLGTWLGNIVFRHISIQVLRHIVYVYMAISGLIALVA